MLSKVNLSTTKNSMHIIRNQTYDNILKDFILFKHILLAGYSYIIL